ncbi:class I SAM-dependent methyltransferase [Luteibaculum oceani]|uniref:SAM-dependent methyltransferase n=1 Tax=Luteibaculum oceani TaxID=1294296 RepID=A0A5C6VJC4_9FLAO|nr:class I SAM-dependent methyltransferase [Luteibaculum oceani]TXC85367.1 SAM-dependent methyltransferase [Luteibaculum oceani]
MPAKAPRNFISDNWEGYQLIDFGKGKRLEQLGDITIIRPDINAHGNPHLSSIKWDQLADAEFVETKSGKGKWNYKNDKRLPLKVQFFNSLVANIKTGPYKHFGLFPEQRSNWHFVEEWIKKNKSQNQQVKVLNLFAYTGASSMVAKYNGSDVIHVDSSKSVINWANENQSINGLSGIRWCFEDALKFIEKEAKRGRKYEGVIMDPPAFGISGKGKRWKIEDQIGDLIENAVKILNPKRHFFVLNTYSPRVNVGDIKNQVVELRGKNNVEVGKLCLISQSKSLLPTGDLIRFTQ